jgi:hypothetical protein
MKYRGRIPALIADAIDEYVANNPLTSTQTRADVVATWLKAVQIPSHIANAVVTLVDSLPRSGYCDGTDQGDLLYMDLHVYWTEQGWEEAPIATVWTIDMDTVYPEALKQGVYQVAVPSTPPTREEMAAHNVQYLRERINQVNIKAHEEVTKLKEQISKLLCLESK